MERLSKMQAEKRMVLGFCGLAGSGKSTCAGFLTGHGISKYSMAGPLKRMMATLITHWGMTYDDAEQYFKDPVKKEQPCDALGGVTPRHAMQTLGTYWGRDCIHPNLWVLYFKRTVERFPYSHFIVDDIRFENEAELIRSFEGGLLIGLRGRGGLTGEAGQHESEKFPEPDVWIENKGNIRRLKFELENLLKERFGYELV